MAESKDNVKEDILLALSISLGALFFATALTLIIAKFYKKIRICCESCCPSESENASSLGFSGRAKPVVSYEKLAKRRNEATAKNTATFLKRTEDDFTIPGGFYASKIQPELKIPSEGEPGSRSTSPVPLPYRQTQQRRWTDSTTSLPANFSPQSAKQMLFSSSSESMNGDSMNTTNTVANLKLSLDDLSSFDMQPEMYNISRKRTLGVGQLGKVRASLQYDDKSKKKLNIFLKELNKLQVIRPDIVGVYASVLLLPEREAIFTTKQQKLSSVVVFEEKFVFASKPMSRDFESKTVLFSVHFVDKSSRNFVYGEARLPLLCKEIYSQVLTDVTINIKTAALQREIGDILLLLIYNETGALHVVVKTVKLPSATSMESMSAIQVKCYLKRLGNRVGKKITLSKPLDGPNMYSVDINGECKFKITRVEDFNDFELTCSVIGKHRIMGKKVQIGKAFIGGSIKGETGASHWKMISDSPGIAWTAWHPICST